MPHMTIRNIDPATPAAIEARAAQDGVSQAEAAREALARGLGVKIKRRSLQGIGAEIFPPETLKALSEIDWTKPAFTDEEWEEMEREEDERTAEWDRDRT